MAVVASGGGASTSALPSGWSRYGGPSGAALNAAPAASWNALLASLASGPLAGKRVIFNVAGEVLPLYGAPSKAAGWTPSDVADFCRKGGVWIDYCGWPMYYAANTAATGNWYSGGFQKFLTAAGAYGLPYSNFKTDTITSSYGGTWKYLRSLVLSKAPPQVSWFDPNLRAPSARPYKSGTVEGNFWVYSSFAVMVGQGAYFYAYGGLHYNANFSFQPGLSPTVYADFINGAAHIMGNGVVPVTTSGGGSPSPTPTGGGSTGSGSGGSSGGSSGGTSGGSSGGKTGGTPSSPGGPSSPGSPAQYTPTTGLSSLSTTEKVILAGGTLAAIVGGIVILRER